MGVPTLSCSVGVSFMLHELFTEIAPEPGKEATTVPRRLGQASPDPRLGPMVQLYSGEAGRLLNFFSISERLPCQCISSEVSPPALLQIEPARPFTADCRKVDPIYHLC